jgi:NADPH-dependent curcumin reductase CurA
MVSFPAGETPTERHFELLEEPVPEPGNGEVLVRTLYLRMDPGSRSKMVPPEESPYEDTWVGDEPVSSGGIGEVVDSKDPKFSQGEFVIGRLRWADYDLIPGDDLERVDGENAPIQAKLHALGHTGRTAYFGMTEIGRPEAGDTVVVSAAAGAVGSVAAQIAKMHGCRVVGIAGSRAKVNHLTDELGLDAGINYNTADSVADAVGEACPNGVDVYYDNVGGELADAVISHLAMHGVIVQCGRTSLINQEGGETPTGPRYEGMYIKKRARREGFVVYDYADRYPEAEAKLAEWYREGDLSFRETVTEGLEHTPEAFFGLFTGENIGKQLVKVAEPSA